VNWVREFLRQEPEDAFFGPVQSADGTIPGAPIEPESAYLGLYLESMRISATRLRGQTFYGVVASTCSVVSRSESKAELVAVSTPESLRGVDPAHLDRVIAGTIPLVGAVPYRGGGVDVEIGLFAVPGTYLMGPYLDLLGDVATVASAFLTPASALTSAALMRPLRTGLDLLLGATSDARLETGLAHTWQTPAVGNYAVVRASEPAGGFRVGAGNRLTNPDGSEVRAPYLLLRLDAHRERHNWAGLPDVAAAYQVIADAARRGDLSGARDALAAFRRVAVFSPDLLASDGQRLHAKVAEQVRQAFPATGTSGALPQVDFPDLADIELYKEP
jgi:hypothetical protein